MSEKKYTKESDLKRLLEILNKSEDHKSLFNNLKTQKKQIETGNFNPDYLGKEGNELESYIRSLDELVTNYKYDPKLKKYVKKLDTFGRIGKKPKMNKGGAVHTDYRKKGLFK